MNTNDRKQMNSEQQRNCCVMTMGIKQVEQLVLLFGRTRLLQLLHRLQNQVQPQLKHNALVAELSDYRLVFLLPSYNRLDTLQLVYELDDQAERIAAQLYDTALALSFGICQPMVCDTLEDAIGYAEYCRTHNRDMERFSTSYAFYTPREKESLHHRFSLEQNILKAVYHHEFHLYLQPKYDSRTHTLIGAEALLRWIHNGMCIPLQEFLPIADENTCIRLLDIYMFEAVCKQLSERKKQGLPLLPVSINVSRSSFEDGLYYLGEILDIQRRYDIASSLLELELHEEIPFERKEQVQLFLRRVKEAGMQCSLDDFGTARSNLHILSWIDVDQIKLDHSFFSNPWNSRKQILLRHMIPMLQQLSIPVLAEGVETREQLEFLSALHCTQIQGFYYSPPLPAYRFFQEHMGSENSSSCDDTD